MFVIVALNLKNPPYITATEKARQDKEKKMPRALLYNIPEDEKVYAIENQGLNNTSTRTKPSFRRERSNPRKDSLCFL